MDKQKILKAGKIAAQVRDYIKPAIKKGTPLLDIAEKMENKIIKLGGKPAFPVNLSINEVAAHYTPSHDDKSLAHGLLKIDFGVHVDGWLSDTAFSIDLENSEKNKNLISASEKALENAIEIFKEEERLSKIGGMICGTIESNGFLPVVNLSGHSMSSYDLHSGVTVPNIDDRRTTKIENKLYAIEPFATTGCGKIHEGNPSGIYLLVNTKNIRYQSSRNILKFIEEEYKTLPFCSRWVVKKFGIKAMISLRQLEANGNLHHFSQLIESKGAVVSQTEHTVLVENNKTIVTTK